MTSTAQRHNLPLLDSVTSSAVLNSCLPIDALMDALESFTHLTENLPLWLTKLEALSAQVAEQHAKFSKLTAATEVKLDRQKTGSTESLRTKKEHPVRTEDEASRAAEAPPTSDPSPSAMQNTANDVLAIKEARRKRKPGSALSAESGPQKYRSRSMVIVYYNSDIQDAFGLLVRNIAGARNNLRKGKTAAEFKKRMASLDMGTPLFSAGGDHVLEYKIGRPLTKTSADTDNTCSIFDAIDKELENAQALCERAAHQMLREGDCKEELLGTKNDFHNSLKMAEKEVERLRAEEQKEAVEEPPMEEPVPIRIDVEEKVTPPSVKPVEIAGIEAIEVDEGSEAESVHVDLSALRRTMRRV